MSARPLIYIKSRIEELIETGLKDVGFHRSVKSQANFTRDVNPDLHLSFHVGISGTDVSDLRQGSIAKCTTTVDVRLISCIDSNNQADDELLAMSFSNMIVPVVVTPGNDNANNLQISLVSINHDYREEFVVSTVRFYVFHALDLRIV